GRLMARESGCCLSAFSFMADCAELARPCHLPRQHKRYKVDRSTRKCSKVPYMSIFSATTPAAVRRALLAKTEIALLDVRHESRFATGHPLFAASFPLGQLEAQAADRLPRRTVPIVVYGDGVDDALAAARRLRELGY